MSSTQSPKKASSSSSRGSSRKKKQKGGSNKRAVSRRRAFPGAAAWVGNSLVRYPLAFSSDSRLILCCSGKNLHVLSSATGAHIATLRGHTEDVTAARVHPFNLQHTISTSLDGTVKIWDVYSGRMLRSFDVGAPIVHMAVSGDMSQQGGRQQVFLAINPSYFQGKIHRCRLLSLNLASGKVSVLYKGKTTVDMAVSADGKFMASVAGRTLYVWSVKDKRLGKLLHARGLTTVCFHPKDPIIATGDADGRITLWYGFPDAIPTGTKPKQGNSDDNKTEATDAQSKSVVAQPTPTAADKAASKVVCSEFHWHHKAVGALDFSPDGAYMLSGGDEAVLVMWQLQSGHRQFLPRLGGPLCGIHHSPDARVLAVRLTNNTLVLVDTVSSQVLRTIPGLQSPIVKVTTERKEHYSQRGRSSTDPSTSRGRGPPWKQSSGPAVVRTSSLNTFVSVDPVGGAAVVPSDGGACQLQFFDVFGERVLGDLTVVARNFVSVAADTASAPVKTVVTNTQFHPRGSWLATVETRKGGTGIRGGDYDTLKVWRRRPLASSSEAPPSSSSSSLPRDPKSFSLHSRIRNPHVGGLVSLAFHPTEDVLVTCGKDKQVRIWTAVPVDKPQLPSAASSSSAEDAERADEQILEWQCTAAAKWRNYHTHDVCFSGDGSLLAVVYGQVITLWDVRSMTLLHDLVHPSPNEHVRHIRFAGDGSVLVAATSRTLYVWDLPTAAVWYSYSLPVAGLACLPTLSHFAVIVTYFVKDGVEAGNYSDDMRQNFILLFDAKRPTPISVWRAHDALIVRHESSEELQRKKGTRAGYSTRDAYMAFVPSLEDQTTSLVYLTASGQLARIDDVLSATADPGLDLALPGALEVSKGKTNKGQQKNQADDDAGIEMLNSLGGGAEQTLAGALFQQLGVSADFIAAQRDDSRLQAATAPAQTATATDTLSALEELFAAPCHILPGPDKLVDSFMDVLLPSTQAHRTTSESAEQTRQPLPHADADDAGGVSGALARDDVFDVDALLKLVSQEDTSDEKESESINGTNSSLSQARAAEDLICFDALKRLQLSHSQNHAEQKESKNSSTAASPKTPRGRAKRAKTAAKSNGVHPSPPKASPRRVHTPRKPHAKGAKATPQAKKAAGSKKRLPQTAVKRSKRTKRTSKRAPASARKASSK